MREEVIRSYGDNMMTAKRYRSQEVVGKLKEAASKANKKKTQ